MAKNLNSWLTYIEERHTQRADLDLDRVQKIIDKLQITKFDCPVVTVAGTNGKGSCVAYLEAIGLEAGLQIGSYTSPHLVCFNERININGKPIDDQSLCEAFALVDNASVKESLTYFDFITLAALLILQQFNLDLILLEIGLGGRLDTVNIIDPDIAVITTISIDHTNYLGPDRDAIGREKAGIMRKNTPIVCGDSTPPKTITAQAKKLNAPYYGAGQQFSYTQTDSTWQWHSQTQKLINLPLTRLPLQNAATALMVVELLQSLTHTILTPFIKGGDCEAIGRFYEGCPDYAFPEHAIRAGLKTASLPGRLQILTEPCELILDVAHNPASAALLARNLNKRPCEGRTIAVTGMLKDKDIAGTLMQMLPAIDTWHVTDLHSPRGATAKTLQEILEQFGQKSCYTHKSVLEAYNNSVDECSNKDRVVVFGSFYTVGDILKHREI